MVNRLQADASMAALCDFLYEACSSIPVAGLDHPRLRQALTCLGATAPPRLEITGARCASSQHVPSHKQQISGCAAWRFLSSPYPSIAVIMVQISGPCLVQCSHVARLVGWHLLSSYAGPDDNKVQAAPATHGLSSLVVLFSGNLSRH